MLLLQSLICLLLISLAQGDSCPILFSPLDVVVKYGDSFIVNCSSDGITHQFSLSWDGIDNTMYGEDISKTVDVRDWEINLKCYMYSNETKCSQNLPITIYKPPDNVSIRTVTHTGPMMEGEQYELQCDVLNVAPVQYLTVYWYKEQTLLDQTTFTDTTETPVNKTVPLLIRPNRADDGAQYRCEAELDLGEEGPQPRPKVTSDPLNVEVYYKPQHSSSTETIIKGDNVLLNCTVKANPAPTYTWDHLKEKNSSSVLQSSALSPGNYTCTATNALGSDSKVFIVDVDNQCPVQIIPRRAVVKYSDSVSVDCKTSVQHEGMGWEASQGRVDMTRDKSLITWMVSNLTEWNIKPLCYINSVKQCEVVLPVTVYKPPDNVSIRNVTHTGPMMEGEQYELQCDVLNVAPVQYLTVYWYKEQTLLDQTTFTDTIETPVNKTVPLLIRPNRADDGAQYRCEAELDLGEEGPQPHPKVTSDPLNIAVNFAPQIKSCKDWSPLTGTSLDSYLLINSETSVVGNPRPVISWRHKSSSVNSSMPLTKYSSGKYEIIARSDLGTVSCFINIRVEYPPELKCNKSYEVKEKTVFKPLCIDDGLPKPDFFLYKNGKLVQNNFIPNWNDSGSYQLTARNPCGNISSSFTLTILHAPVFCDSQNKLVVGEGSDITLECCSTGNPEPEVSWIFKNKTLSTGRRHMNIKRATSTDAGVYTCSAKNEMGCNDKTFLVEIKENFPIYIIIVVVVLILLVLFIFLLVLIRKRRRSRGRYDIVMQPISNGGHK